MRSCKAPGPSISPKGEEIWKMKAKIVFYERRIRAELRMKKELKMMWKR